MGQHPSALGMMSMVGTFCFLYHPPSPCSYIFNSFSPLCLLSSLSIWLLPGFSLCVDDDPQGIAKPWQAAPDLVLF